MKTILASLILVLCLVPTASMAQETPQINLQRTMLSVGIHQIDAQLAVTPSEHAIGLMYR